MFCGGVSYAHRDANLINPLNTPSSISVITLCDKSLEGKDNHLI